MTHNSTGTTCVTLAEQLLQAMERCKAQAGSLATGIDHFLKVTRSYAPGLFHCYDIESLPRTNNDLEQLFGSWRHHQRRCTGRARCPSFLGCKRFSPNRVSHRNSNTFVYGSRRVQRSPLTLGVPFEQTSIVINTSVINNGNFVAPQ